jgi:nitroimidazol reductase NimA-like FMN-containing flavoprotein (pyridoxamine 5'-phosphate oxidase superfamily)
MRRTDREIKDFDAILSVIEKCAVCRVAFFDAGHPYIVPLNFGFETQGDELTLYFHCAKAGKKLDLLRQNDKVAFEMDRPEGFADGEKACYSTMEFESVCGTGTIGIAGEDEKMHGLTLLMRQYSDKQEIVFDEKVLKDVLVLKLAVGRVTGKRLKQDR